MGQAPIPPFQEVYRTHFRFVWRTLGRLGVREADLMDVTQDVFLVVHRQLAGFEGRSELSTWLFSICRWVAKDYLQSAPIRREIIVDVREIAQQGIAGDRPLLQLDTQDLSDLLRAILGRMPEKLRIVFLMFELDEMSGEEIAHLLRLPLGTVRSRLRLARVAFQREVKRLGVSNDRHLPSTDGAHLAKDPARLRSGPESVEARLLQSSPSFEPTPSSEEEIWHRLALPSVAGGGAGASVAAHAAAAGSSVAGKALWPAVLKWGLLVAASVPAVVLTQHRALRREVQASIPAIQDDTPGRPQFASAPLPWSAPSEATRAAAVVDAPVRHPASPGSTSLPSRIVRPAESDTIGSASALTAESLLLAGAHAKFAGGDPRGALDDVAQMGIQFPRGRLAQEREIVAINSLAALGHREMMRARTAAFLERFPDSPYRVHLRRLVSR